MNGPLRRPTAALAVLAALVGSVATAQFRGGRFGMRLQNNPPYDGAFQYCRGMYRRHPQGDGGGWTTDYPQADENLPFRFAELTKASVSRDEHGRFNHQIVALTDPALYKCPILIMQEVGSLYLDDADAAGLRDYLVKGGFLWVDDFWGTPAWDQWSDQIARVLPEFPILDTTPADPIRQALFTVANVKQVPSIFTWGGPGSDPRERGADSPHANFRVITDAQGRVIVAMTHNTDIGDSMEREGDDPAYFAEFSPEGYALATNIVLYALTH